MTKMPLSLGYLPSATRHYREDGKFARTGDKQTDVMRYKLRGL
jgi:hypothetical protein